VNFREFISLWYWEGLKGGDFVGFYEGNRN
jgi:hypothetical protein